MHPKFFFLVVHFYFIYRRVITVYSFSSQESVGVFFSRIRIAYFWAFFYLLLLSWFVWRNIFSSRRESTVIGTNMVLYWRTDENTIKGKDFDMYKLFCRIFAGFLPFYLQNCFKGWQIDTNHRLWWIMVQTMLSHTEKKAVKALWKRLWGLKINQTFRKTRISIKY